MKQSRETYLAAIAKYEAAGAKRASGEVHAAFLMNGITHADEVVFEDENGWWVVQDTDANDPNAERPFYEQTFIAFKQRQEGEEP